ncbi:MAG: MCE family protein [Gammaproteobacteria bacterium]|nr:MCE family protein [Gammaproteobacteria bacterium]
MGNKPYVLATGAFVLLLVAALAAIAFWLSGYRVARVPYVLVSQHAVSGLSPQAAVYYRGVPVGTVNSIAFDPQDSRNILVRIDIDPGVPITRGTYGTLQPQGITGVANIELDDSGQDRTPLPTSATAPARLPLDPSLLDTLLDSGRTLLSRLSKLAADLDQFVSTDNRKHVTQILANTETATRQLAAVEEQLRTALATVPGLSRDAQRTMGNIDAVSKRMQTLAGSLDALARSATQFSHTGNAAGEDLRQTTLPQLNDLLAQMSAATRQLQQFTTTLQQDPQSLLYGKSSPPPGPGEAGYRK